MIPVNLLVEREMISSFWHCFKQVPIQFYYYQVMKMAYFRHQMAMKAVVIEIKLNKEAKVTNIRRDGVLETDSIPHRFHTRTSSPT